MDTAWENWIRAMEEPCKVTRNGVGFTKCLNFRRKDYELLERNFFLMLPKTKDWKAK